jgi:hypothetical protein
MAENEPSTNSRWWDLQKPVVWVCSLQLNHPPTDVGGISDFWGKPRVIDPRFDYKPL